MKRRSFLQAGLMIGTTGLLRQEGKTAEIDTQSVRRIKIGFLGASHSHALEKVRIAQSSTSFQLIGVCEEDERVRQRYQNLRVPFIPQGRLLEEAELIAVESDVKDHARHAKLALEAGKHIHLEKPATDTLESCKELLRLAGQKGRLLQLGYMWRFNPGVNCVLEAARKGWLGEIYLVRGSINTSITGDQRPHWSPFPGGTMFELGCHLIDPLVRLMGKPTKITTTLKKHGSFPDDLIDNAVAVFEFQNALGIISSATLQPNAGAQRSFEVLGTNGTARLSPIEQPRLQIDLSRAAGPYTAGAQILSFPPYRRYAPEFMELKDAILAGKPLGITHDEELLVQDALLRACDMLRS
jgi:predicted dehydrogenase